MPMIALALTLSLTGAPFGMWAFLDFVEATTGDHAADQAFKAWADAKTASTT